MPLTPARPIRHRARRARSRLGALGAAATVASLTALLALTVSAGAAWAQSGTTDAPPVTTPAENPGSTAAGFVFFGVTGAIIVGALLLYLRNRRPPVTSER